MQQKLNPRAIVFDIDDVLVDVTHSCRLAAKRTGEFFLGRVMPAQEVQEMLGSCCSNHYDASEEFIRRKGGNFRKDAIIKKFQEHYFGRNLRGLAYSEKLLINPEMLKKVKRFKVGIVSGRPRAEVLDSLERFGLSKCFKEIVAMEDVAEKKPNPAGLLMMLNRLKAANAGALFIAAGIADARASREAGIPFIGILPLSADKKSYSEQLKMEGAIHVFESINSLRSVLG